MRVYRCSAGSETKPFQVPLFGFELSNFYLLYVQGCQKKLATLRELATELGASSRNLADIFWTTLSQKGTFILCFNSQVKILIY